MAVQATPLVIESTRYSRAAFKLRTMIAWWKVVSPDALVRMETGGYMMVDELIAMYEQQAAECDFMHEWTVFIANDAQTGEWY